MVCVCFVTLTDDRYLLLLSPSCPCFSFFPFSFFSLTVFFFFRLQKSMLLSKQRPPLSVCNRRLFDQTTNRPRCLLSWLLVPLTVAPINVWTYSLELGFWKICPFHFQSRLGRCCTAVWERRSGGNSAAPRLSIIMYISLSTGVTCDLFYRSLWLFLTLSNRCSLFFPRSIS